MNDLVFVKPVFEKLPVFCMGRLKSFYPGLLQHFFASFLSRDEAFRLIIDGWVQHSSYAKLFLNSQGSLASLAMVYLMVTWLDCIAVLSTKVINCLAMHKLFDFSLHLSIYLATYQILRGVKKFLADKNILALFLLICETDGLVGNRVHNPGHLEQRMAQFPIHC